MSKNVSAPRYAQTAAWDFVQGLSNWRLWAFLGLHDIKQRYRRSLFGPLWLALGLGVTIFGIGILYSQILKTNPGSFIPFLAVSLLIWNLLAGVINESTTLFLQASGTITSVKVPYTSFTLRAITRNLIVAAHCTIPVIIAFAAYKYSIGPVALFSLVGFALIVLNLYWISLLIGIICLRFRDIGQIVIYTMQLALFLTPIIWMPNQVTPGSPYMVYNPFYHLVNLVRGPVFYGRIPVDSIVASVIMLVVGGLITGAVMTRCRRNIVFWV